MAFLYDKIEAFREFRTVKSVPHYLSQNLNPNFELRPYQIQAFENFITFFEGDKCPKPTQLLFHMATGSGKTLIMAGLMLYLYKQGYRNFLFFVNLSNIVEKTKVNFCDSTTSKYLFAEEIIIDGERVKINQVSNFQNSDPNAINICFATTQGLHSDMWGTKENCVSFDDFESQKVVLISDEAHHLKAFMDDFIDMIGKLTADQLEVLSNSVDTDIMRTAFHYFADHGISLDTLAAELHDDFSESHCVSVNDDKDATQKQLLLNSLEDMDNPYRAIFEVKKLDEGWDVLNLFDIVRLYETRQSGGKKISPATIAEAQLIGRGARYARSSLMMNNQNSSASMTMMLEMKCVFVKHFTITARMIIVTLLNFVLLCLKLVLIRARSFSESMF